MIPIFTRDDEPNTRIGSNLVTENLAMFDLWGMPVFAPKKAARIAYGFSLGQFKKRLPALERIFHAWRSGSQLGILSQLLISMAVADVSGQCFQLHRPNQDDQEENLHHGFQILLYATEVS